MASRSNGVRLKLTCFLATIVVLVRRHASACLMAMFLMSLPRASEEGAFSPMMTSSSLKSLARSSLEEGFFWEHVTTSIWP
ncbi:hypothetical protein BXZ70DRAFT_317182 [Cristinia sonorae]|uniref:Uncharacterized protein n=1 Tax=Cristinia sonorae TaxID=1940300 RepID=A0A8K0UKE1_9AGAR|nr:hypothetical protein BXZ70DRAFT_317182 [Cristinia sonorae]